MVLSYLYLVTLTSNSLVTLSYKTVMLLAPPTCHPLHFQGQEKARGLVKTDVERDIPVTVINRN